jgi:hypothetical protein
MDWLVWVAAANPDPVAVTVKVEVTDAGDAGGVYLTLIVQFCPGLSVVVAVQLPPGWIENAPVPDVCVIVGLALKVVGPAFAPPLVVLVIVTVPFFTVRPPPPSPEAAKVSTAPVIRKFTVPEVPFGVVTEIAWLPRPLLGTLAIVKVAVIEVPAAFTTTLLTVMPEPAGTLIVPPVRLVPVSVTLTALPRTPEVGEMLVRVGVSDSTVNVTAFVVPFGVTTVTFLEPSAAVAEIVKVATTVVSLTTPIALTVTPAPDTLIADVPVRPLPVRVTGTLVPRTPVLGLILVRRGATAAPVFWDSTAPTSKTVSLSGRGFPKKSVVGRVTPAGRVSLVGMWSMAEEDGTNA